MKKKLTFIVLLIFSNSNCQESIIAKDSINLIRFSNPDAGINSIEFIVYKDLVSLSEEIKKIKYDSSNCSLILKFKIVKLDKIELVSYTSNCNFENNILDFLKDFVHLKIIKCEMKIESTELYLPIKIMYD
jgi:hypothetical protein